MLRLIALRVIKSELSILHGDYTHYNSGETAGDMIDRAKSSVLLRNSHRI